MLTSPCAWARGSEADLQDTEFCCYDFERYRAMSQNVCIAAGLVSGSPRILHEL